MFERVKLIPINKHIWLMNDANEATGYIVVGNEKAMIIDELPPHTRDFSRELGGFTCTIKVRMV